MNLKQSFNNTYRTIKQKPVVLYFLLTLMYIFWVTVYNVKPHRVYYHYFNNPTEISYLIIFLVTCVLLSIFIWVYYGVYYGVDDNKNNAPLTNSKLLLGLLLPFIFVVVVSTFELSLLLSVFILIPVLFLLILVFEPKLGNSSDLLPNKFSIPSNKPELKSIFVNNYIVLLFIYSIFVILELYSNFEFLLLYLFATEIGMIYGFVKYNTMLSMIKYGVLFSVLIKLGELIFVSTNTLLFL